MLILQINFWLQPIFGATHFRYKKSASNYYIEVCHDPDFTLNFSWRQLWNFFGAFQSIP